MVRSFHTPGSNRGLIFFIFALILDVPDQNINHPINWVAQNALYNTNRLSLLDNELRC